MKILFLDDMVERWLAWQQANQLGNELVWCQTAAGAIEMLALGDWDLATLDHDLQEEHYERQHSGEGTGQGVAHYIAAMPPEKRPKRVKIHSWNRDGALAMQAILRDAGIDAPWQPFNARREA